MKKYYKNSSLNQFHNDIRREIIVRFARNVEYKEELDNINEFKKYIDHDFEF